MSVESKILELIFKEAPHCIIDNTTSKGLPFADVGLDSLDIMTVMLNISDELGVNIPDKDIAKLNTFEKLSTYVKIKVGEEE